MLAATPMIDHDRDRAIRFLERWVVANAFSELVGLGGIALSLWLLSTIEPPIAEWLLAAIAISLGAFEGLLVGGAQWLVLVERLPVLAPRTWIGATVAGALAAWALGMLPSLLIGQEGAPMPEPSELATFLLAGLLGLVAGPLLAGAQWLVLRRHLRHAWLWIVANAVAWGVGMPIIFAGVDLAYESGAWLLLALSIALAGGLVGVLHGAVLVRMLAGGMVVSSPRSDQPT